MYNYIFGKLVDIDENKIVVENNNIGYEIFIPTSNIHLLPQIDEEIKVYTYLLVKEDDMSLYGFINEEDKKMFLLLITVSGVGPKGALSIISNYSFNELIQIISNGDNIKISKVSGIGNKTASKIIIELSDKIKKLKYHYQIDDNNLSDSNSTNISNVQKEVIEALCNLGYQKKSAIDLVHSIKCTDDISADELLKLALKT